MQKGQNGNKANTFAQVHFFANESTSLPQILHVGDIVRVHRVNVIIYRNQKQFNSNTWNRSSWVVFKGARAMDHSNFYNVANCQVPGDSESLEEHDPYVPIASSNNMYSFHDSEI